MAAQFNQEVLQDDVAHVHTPHTGFSVVFFISHILLVI